LGLGPEIEVTRIEAAVKLSQNQKVVDYEAIVEKLSASGDRMSARWPGRWCEERELCSRRILTGSRESLSL